MPASEIPQDPPGRNCRSSRTSRQRGPRSRPPSSRTSRSPKPPRRTTDRSSCSPTPSSSPGTWPWPFRPAGSKRPPVSGSRSSRPSALPRRCASSPSSIPWPSPPGRHRRQARSRRGPRSIASSSPSRRSATVSGRAPSRVRRILLPRVGYFLFYRVVPERQVLEILSFWHAKRWSSSTARSARGGA